MGKALKPLIIIQLLVSIAALWLAVDLFSQREVLKKRTQNLEDASKAFADSIRFDEFKKSELVVEKKEDFPKQQQALKLLAAAGNNQYDDLITTKQDLENTRQDLEQTRVELANTKNELNDTREQVAQLTDSLNQREAELAQANVRVGELESQTAALQSEVESLNNQYAELEEELGDCEANYQSLKLDFDKLVGETTGGPAARGLAGRILLVNPDWNFVILNIGSEKGLAPTAEMLVHRSDRLVGRVRINSVNETMAVAEILGDWEQKSIRKGDFVISPES